MAVTLVKALDGSQRQTAWLAVWTGWQADWLAGRLADWLAGGWTANVTGNGRFWHLREAG